MIEIFDSIAKSIGIGASDLYFILVSSLFFISVLYITYIVKIGKNNPYPLYFITRFFDKSVKKVMMFEVEIVGNQPIASFKGHALYGSKGLYFGLTDTVYEIPTDMFLKGYDSIRLFYKRYGKIGILPLRVFAFDISENKIGELEKNKEGKLVVSEYGGNIGISLVDAKMTLLLTDSYISTFYRRLMAISLQTRDSFDNFVKEHGGSIMIVIVSLFALAITAWGMASMLKELKGACGV